MKSRIKGVHLFPLKKREDERGWLTEIFRNDQLHSPPEMGYVSETLPGVERGPHEHEDQTDHFAFMGPGIFHLHLWDGRFFPSSNSLPSYEVWEVGETNPVLAIVPPGVVHAYKNISEKPGWVFNMPDQLYAGPGKLYEVDEVRHENNAENKFSLYKSGWAWSVGGNAADTVDSKD